MKYEIDIKNHQDWLDKGPWYNIATCSRLYGSMFEYFITHTRTDIHNLLCYLVANDKKQPAYEDEQISIGDRLITKHATTEVLEALGATLDFIEIWIKLLEFNYEVIFEMYNKSMKEMFKHIPATMTKPLSPRQKSLKLIT